MSKTKIDTYLKYGVPSDKARKAISKNLSASSFKTISKKNLISEFGLEPADIDFIKNCLKRTPIETDTLNRLLENSNYLCCLCKGDKGDAFIVHHIEEYSNTQSNEYSNLAVLCPNDHDLAHREGINLTQKISKDQIREAKQNWEKTVHEENVRKASIRGDVENIDFLNVYRIIETAKDIFKKIPETSYSVSLIEKNILHNDGHLNLNYLSELGVNIHTPLNFFGPIGSAELNFHYFEIVKKILGNVEFKDLDMLLNKEKLKEGIINEYCFYVGGLYGKRPDLPINENTPLTHLYFKRKPFYVEWKVDPRYLTSNTSTERIGGKSKYVVYGRIRSVGNIENKGKSYIHVDIRPLAFGAPKISKNRTPFIFYEKQWDDMFPEQ